MSLQTAGEDHVASASQPLKVLLANNLCDNCQSVDRAHRGTETDLIDVMNCLPGRANEAQVSVLTLLDLWGAFDTLDHSILLERLHDMFGISGKALGWFSSYLSDRFQAVSVNGRISSQKKFVMGFLVVQSWALCPLLCIVNYCLKSFLKVGAVMTDLLLILNFTSLQLHLSLHSLVVDVEQCVDSSGRWMTGNRLKLNNADKTDVVLVSAGWKVSVIHDKPLKSCKAMLKISGYILTLLCLWWSIIVIHISRSAYLEIKRYKIQDNALKRIR